MLRIKLSKRRPVAGLPLEYPWLPRTFSGWDPAMSTEEVYDAARGWWRLAQRAEAEKYALVAARGPDGLLVRMAIEITEWRKEGNRRAFAGRVLVAGHPVYDAYAGKADPVPSVSQFPVQYLKSPFDRPDTCRCGCNEAPTTGEWAQGHELRALSNMIATDFPAASFPHAVSAFLDWYETPRR